MQAQLVMHLSFCKFAVLQAELSSLRAPNPEPPLVAPTLESFDPQ